MSEDSRDESDHDLFRPALERLFRQELDDLGGENCRDLLSEILQDRWEQLTAQACHREKNPMPTAAHALLAFDSLKHVLLGDIQLLELTLPEVWRFLKRIQLRYWLWTGSALFGVLATVATVGYEVGSILSK